MGSRGASSDVVVVTGGNCNNNHKYDRLKQFLKEDEKVMVEVINGIPEPLNYTKVKVLWNTVNKKCILCIP